MATLADIDVDTLVWRLRRRANVTVQQLDPHAVEWLCQCDWLLPTGVSALDDVARRRLNVKPGEWDACITQADLAELGSTMSWQAQDTSADVRLRVVDTLAVIPVTLEHKPTPAAVALDLCDERDCGRQREGRDRLLDALNRFQRRTEPVTQQAPGSNRTDAVES